MPLQFMMILRQPCNRAGLLVDYGPMENFEFEQLKAWVEFAPRDAAYLRQLGPRMRPHLVSVVNRFYDRLTRIPEAKAVLGGEDAAARLRIILRIWLGELFEGEYADQYLAKRSEIGRTHVRVNLPQRFMFSGMNIIRAELIGLIRSFEMADGDETIDALNKLLDLELAIMIGTYRDHYVAKIRDSDKRAMQNHLDEIQHMASLGQLAASLAHEIKNPLAGISGAIQIMSQEMDSDHPHREIMAEILRQIDRLDTAVEDLLIYARPKPPEMGECDVGGTIQACLSLLKEDPLIKALTVECDGLDGEIRTLLDRSQFEQVVSNLVLNAAQACGGNGTLRICLSEKEGRVLIAFSDSGPGMTPEVLRHALEPFYTTKARGTGLGLPICKRIIEAHQGTIAIETAPFEGTTITLSVPSLGALAEGEDR